MKNLITGIILLFTISITLNAQCPNKCLECDPSGTICFACDDGLAINVFGQCNQNNIQNCVIYGPSGECFNCEPTFKLEGELCVKDYTGCILSNSNDGTCFQCGFGTIISGNLCTGVINCQQYDDVCLKCRQGYILDSNVCRDISAGCNMVRNYDGLCQSCFEGYNYIGYKCIHQNITVPRCYIYNQAGSCLSCQNGFKLYQGKCLITKQIQQEQMKRLQIQNQQVQNCQVPDILNPGRCLVCVYGYYPSQNQCKQVSKFCGQHNVQTGECFDCKYGLQLNAGQCIDNNCQSSFDDGTCEICVSPYQTNQNGVCQFNDPNCLQRFNSRCQLCREGFYVNAQGDCQMLPPFCKYANFQTGTCLQCQIGFRQKDGVCQMQIRIQNCQVQDTAQNICIICDYGYYPSGNTCLLVSPLCGNHNVQNGDCLDCKNQYLVLQGRQCVDLNCISRGSNGDCITCKDNFIYNPQYLVCKINDINCEVSNSIGCMMCKNGFYISQDSTCQFLPLNCLQASPQGNCITCMNNYNSVNGICTLFNLPNCLNPDSFSGRCFQCQNGYDLTNDGQCIRRFIPTPMPTNPTMPTMPTMPTNPTNPSFSSQTRITTGDQINFSSDPNCLQSTNGVCSKCSKRYYLSENKCVPINPLCKTHNDNGECTTCYRGYTLNYGKCQLGLRTDPNCKTQNNGICSECYKGFYYNTYDKICKRVNPLCKTSNFFNGKCESCYPGYQLNANSGSCDVFFKDPNCKTFNSDNYCNICSKRYYLSSSTGKCTPVNPLCLDYDMNTGFCTVCYQGYQINQGLCIPAVSQDPNCRTFSNGYCTQCYTRYYPRDGVCEKVNPNCKDYNKVNGNCGSCYPGFVLQYGTCQQSEDQNCRKFSTTNSFYCVQCYKGYLAINGRCQTKNPLCKTQNMQNGKCLTCWRGYVLVQGDCFLQSQVQPKLSNGQVDPYCIKLVNGICQICTDSFYFDVSLGHCQQVDSLCKTYDKNTGYCTSCWVGYTEYQGKCVLAVTIMIPYCQIVGPLGDCSYCMDNYYLKNGKCQLVSILCGGDYNRNTGLCRSCVPGYYLQEGQCIFPALYDARCIHYTSSYCDKCQFGYFIESYQCSKVDDQCKDFNYYDKVCNQCANDKRPLGRDCI